LLRFSQYSRRISWVAGAVGVGISEAVVINQWYRGYTTNWEFWTQIYIMNSELAGGVAGMYLGAVAGGAVGGGWFSWLTAPLGAVAGGSLGSWVCGSVAAIHVKIVRYCYGWWRKSLSDEQDRRLFEFIYERYGPADS